MDEFRVGSISPYDPDRGHDLPGAAKRRREKRGKDQALEADEFIAAAEEPEAAQEPAEDYYEPSGPSEE